MEIDSDRSSPEVIELPEVTNVASYIRESTRSVVGLLSVKSRRGQVAKPELFDRFRLFMNWAETLPWGAASLKLEQRRDMMNAMKTIFHGPLTTIAGADGPDDTYFAQEDKDRARALFEEWSTLQNEETAGDESDQVSDEQQNDLINGVPAGGQTRSGREVAASQTAGASQMRVPPKNHPIYGPNGPMHGIAISQGSQRIAYRLNPRTKSQQRSALKLGDNGHHVGDWWPIQMAALFNGVHGSAKGGISGQENVGAFSIVVSGYYHGLDQDQGNIVYYSGSGSQENMDPNHPKMTKATGLLHKSLQTGNPVRLLRSSSGGASPSIWAPRVGIRYDGQYRIVNVETLSNSKGGKYYRFELHRLDGQRELNSEYVRSIPSAEQIRQFNAVKEGY